MATPRSRSRPRDSEALRLQKDMETLTKTISLQQRRTASLDESLRIVAGEVAAKRELLQTVIPTPRDLTRLNQKAALLENQLMQEKVALNREQKENRSLQDQINEFRREKNRLQAYFRELREESDQMESDAKNFSEKHHSFDANETDFKVKLVMMREKAVKKAQETQSIFGAVGNERSRGRDFAKTLNMSLFTDNEVFVDSISVLRQLYKKWVEKVKEQKKIVEQYNRTVRFLTDSFEEVKDATGVPSIDEMVTSYIKAYEQEQDMTEALTKLSSEADYLQDSLTALEQLHKEQMQSQRDKMSKQRESIETLKKELDNLRSLMEKKVTQERELKGEMKAVNAPVVEIVNKFRACEIPPGPIATGASSESDLQHNIKELEAGITFLLSYWSSGSGIPSSMFESSIANKSFNYHIRLASTQSAIPGRKSIDDIEEPLTEAELRSRAIQRIQSSKTFDQ